MSLCPDCFTGQGCDDYPAHQCVCTRDCWRELEEGGFGACNADCIADGSNPIRYLNFPLSTSQVYFNQGDGTLLTYFNAESAALALAKSKCSTPLSDALYDCDAD